MYLLFQYLHWKFPIFTMMHNGSILGLVHIISELFYMLEIMQSRFLLLLDLHWNFPILVKDELFYILKINVVLLSMLPLWHDYGMVLKWLKLTLGLLELGRNLECFYCDLHEDIFLGNFKEIFFSNFFRNILGNLLAKFLRKCFREIFWEFFWKLF